MEHLLFARHHMGPGLHGVDGGECVLWAEENVLGKHSLFSFPIAVTGLSVRKSQVEDTAPCGKDKVPACGCQWQGL